MSRLNEFFKSVLAGVFIGLGAFASQIGGIYGGKIAVAIIFPIGLILVLATGSNLFTGKCLLIESVLDGDAKGWHMALKLALYWILNFAGALEIALVLKVSELAPDNLKEIFISLAENKYSITPYVLFIRGILCNCCVCLAVLCYSKMSVIGAFIPTFLFVLCGFEHSIANMFYVPMAILYGANLTIGNLLLDILLPVTLGNLVGGFLIGTIRHVYKEANWL